MQFKTIFKNFSVASLFVFILTLTGCASMFSGSTDVINVSVPSNTQAQIFYGNRFVGVGAASFNFKRSLSNTKQITVNGLNNCVYPAVDINTTFNAVALLNIFFWPGFIIDALTGSLVKADETSYSVSPSYCNP